MQLLRMNNNNACVTTLVVSEVGCKTKSLYNFSPSLMKEGEANQTGQMTVHEIYQQKFGIRNQIYQRQK